MAQFVAADSSKSTLDCTKAQPRWAFSFLIPHYEKQPYFPQYEIEHFTLETKGGLHMYGSRLMLHSTN